MYAISLRKSYAIMKSNLREPAHPSMRRGDQRALSMVKHLQLRKSRPYHICVPHVQWITNDWSCFSKYDQ